MHLCHITIWNNRHISGLLLRIVSQVITQAVPDVQFILAAVVHHNWKPDLDHTICLIQPVTCLGLIMWLEVQHISQERLIHELQALVVQEALVLQEAHQCPTVHGEVKFMRNVVHLSALLAPKFYDLFVFIWPFQHFSCDFVDFFIYCKHYLFTTSWICMIFCFRILVARTEELVLSSFAMALISTH